MTTEDALKKLRKDLKDPNYREVWVANIAMSVFDEYVSEHSHPEGPKIKSSLSPAAKRQFLKTANKGAERFIDLLISCK